MPNPFSVALIGNPNSGKSTLFNQLTGLNQQVGNWPGVTVDYQQGYFDDHQQHIHLIDLPGCYRLSSPLNQASIHSTALDQLVTFELIRSGSIDCFVNVVSALALKRHLYLTVQLQNQLSRPLVVVLNCMDQAQTQGISINTMLLSKR